MCHLVLAFEFRQIKPPVTYESVTMIYHEAESKPERFSISIVGVV